MKKQKAFYPTTKQLRDLHNGTCAQIALPIKPQPISVIERGEGKTLRWFARYKESEIISNQSVGKHEAGIGYHSLDSPFGVPADDQVLYARESFLTGYEFEDDKYKLDENDEPIDKVWYGATDVNLQWYSEGEPVECPPWKSSRVMPKAIARFWLKPYQVYVDKVIFEGEEKWCFVMNFDIVDNPNDEKKD